MIEEIIEQTVGTDAGMVAVVRQATACKYHLLDYANFELTNNLEEYLSKDHAHYQ